MGKNVKKGRNLSITERTVLEDKLLKEVSDLRSLLKEGRRDDAIKVHRNLTSIQGSSLYFSLNNSLKGDLELLEMNFIKANKFYRKSMNTEHFNCSTYIKLCNLKQTMGDLEESRKYLDAAIDKRHYYSGVAMLELVIYYIYDGDLDAAYNLIKTIHIKNFGKYFISKYKFLYQYIISELNYNDSLPRELNNVIDFKYEIHSATSDYLMRTSLNTGFKTSSFIQDGNFNSDDLLDFALLYIKNNNPVRGEDVDFYSPVFDDDVAIIDGEYTKHFTVCTLFNSDKVIAMNPFLPTEDYNSSGGIEKYIRKR